MRFVATSLPSSLTKRILAVVVAVCAMHSPQCYAQFGFGGFGRLGVVGGVRIDADGVLRTATEQEQNEALQEMRQHIAGGQGAFAAGTSMRMVSLSKIQKLVTEAAKSGTQLPEEVLYLGGLTRVEYVFAFPERNDIVIAGPAEPWTAGVSGSVVGKKSGRPVVLLEDLVGAFKYVSQARETGISVSIDPTEQGRRQLNQLLSNVGANPNLKQLEAAMNEAFGPQQVTLTGVPSDSHMARVILAADYRMKLYGMNLAEAPVMGLPSYLEMIQSRATASSQLQSRWWMACDYNSIAHSRDKLAWHISGPGIKTMTEQEQVNMAGGSKQTGKVDVLAKKWADLFTQKMDELSVKDPVFGELRNVMDLCVVAALIESQNLQSMASCDLNGILGDGSNVELPKFEVPTSLNPQVSFLQTVQGLLVSASGGVMIDSWQVAMNVKDDESVSTAREQAAAWSNADSWYQ
jgi:hypothetical protein